MVVSSECRHVTPVLTVLYKTDTCAIHILITSELNSNSSVYANAPSPTNRHPRRHPHTAGHIRHPQRHPQRHPHIFTDIASPTRCQPTLSPTYRQPHSVTHTRDPHSVTYITWPTVTHTPSCTYCHPPTVTPTTSLTT